MTRLLPNRLVVILTLLTVSLVTVIPVSADEFIRQKEILSGLTWDFHVSSGNGKSWSPIPVSKGGSTLSLHALGSAPDTHLYKLDETALGNGFPTTLIGIKSEDPHYPPRTRADRPFTVNLQVKGIASTGKTVSLHHKALPYNPTTHAAKEEVPEESVGWWNIQQQGQQQGRFYSNLTSADPTQAEGLETFTAYAISSNPNKDGHSSRAAIPLKSAAIHIWPVATVTIQGIKQGDTQSSADLKKSVSILCQDLYPDSVTYVQIYHGKAKLGTAGTVLPQSVVRFDTVVPQDQVIPLGEWRDNLVDGKYTVEVLTITPFNKGKPERLAHVTFTIDRGMHAPSIVTREP